MHYGSIKSNAFWDIAQFRPFICTHFLIQFEFCGQVMKLNLKLWHLHLFISREPYILETSFKLHCISVSKLIKISPIWYHSEKLHILCTVSAYMVAEFKMFSYVYKSNEIVKSSLITNLARIHP